MVSADRTLLRLHVEAVWGVQLSPFTSNDLELAPQSARPAWKLCVAAIATGRVHIWRPDVNIAEREDLRLRADEALVFPPIAPIPGVSREVALSQIAAPRLDIATARGIARPLTLNDRELIERFFAPGDSLEDNTHPHIGVVVAGRLLCLAHSSRRTPEACELGIETLPEARRKGYALAATILWAHAVAQEGLVPIYSAFAENTASLRLADAAGYRAFARIAVFEG
ncbi:MAG TPA: GNAT family N-acetyltransferase [Ktedonobacteraceae bacterium]|nr:GNAT family N-acetyltransferase [Ktedonobacteraceae bacterium]